MIPTKEQMERARQVWQAKARDAITDAHRNIYRWRTDEMIIETMAEFATEAVEAEREACAREAEQWNDYDDSNWKMQVRCEHWAKTVAAAIRARGASHD